MTIFVEKSDGLYRSANQLKKNIIFNHISVLSPYFIGQRYFLIFIKKKKKKMKKILILIDKPGGIIDYKECYRFLTSLFVTKQCDIQ